MCKKDKVLGKDRKELILKWLKESNTPMTGGELADRTNVSRQVIVQDISLLKARNEPILATSQGYMYMKQNKPKQFERVIACKHTPEETRKELELVVDHGVTVKNVFIEHPVYGDLEASIMVSNRKEVDQFIQRIKETNSPYLLQLTGGIHLHTITADTEEKLDLAFNALDRAGIIIES
ncbi:transcription repressor NadR [Aquibacillus albus]|uniref:Transcriptional regulator of NAD metabolism n=1 Tax=Aquibacillus albus TaxID=1168171 RepID=A0ABS2N1U2_9BACI|nr:transcription repressor NadR [Aquibacillus albus]MBM7572043.1 transcriptional regulator of NAD metabolism [Aquibacillus albus]